MPVLAFEIRYNLSDTGMLTCKKYSIKIGTNSIEGLQYYPLMIMAIYFC